MGQPFVGEIRMFGGNFAPAGWAMCNGATMPISENEALFNLIGTTYGGDGMSTFRVPDLRGRIPVHAGGSHVVGELGGTDGVALTVQQLSAHSHAPIAADSAASSADPTKGTWANSPGSLHYSATAGGAPMAAQAVASTGGNQPHDNTMPYLCVHFIISLYGVWPSQT